KRSASRAFSVASHLLIYHPVCAQFWKLMRAATPPVQEGTTASPGQSLCRSCKNGQSPGAGFSRRPAKRSLVVTVFEEIRDVPVARTRHRNVSTRVDIQQVRDVGSDSVLQGFFQIRRFFNLARFDSERFSEQQEVRIVRSSIRFGEFGSVAVLEVS